MAMAKAGMRISGKENISRSMTSYDIKEKIPKVSRTDKKIHPNFINFKNTRAYHVSNSVKTLATHENNEDSFDVALKTADVWVNPLRLQMIDAPQNFNNLATRFLRFHKFNLNSKNRKLGTMSIGSGHQRNDNGPLSPTLDTTRKNHQNDSNEIFLKKGRRKRSLKSKPGQSAGRWTPEEHQEFLEGLKIFGREWKKVAERIPTRTSAQIRSHAQKYFAKLAREENMMLQDQHAASIGNGPNQTNTFVTVPEPVVNVSISVQRNVNRILANPSNVQNEVEETLIELRERYRQLQIRLEDTIRQQNGTVSLVETGCLVESSEQYENPLDISNESIEQSKHYFGDIAMCKAKQLHQDDMSSVSTVSVVSCNRELGDEELIALSVLGGSLPGGSSSKHHILGKSKIERSPSPTSTIASNQDTDEADDKTRKRKFRDGKLID
eukprot:CAMPEP_0194150242 /NCGR_PEP_ID=MMETSP0152-20130528/42246_1 /TAXON_ID=1049557 /ORGANISM="Thalassiothrix antarctica, Strain L6-D1" /LENGTH=437 /DNA_ID=CAMNT_0038853037 /DNA_START=27 /DNA_END=1340 /DNA_ORIENTATION=-